jgi:hypothetical protein
MMMKPEKHAVAYTRTAFDLRSEPAMTLDEQMRLITAYSIVKQRTIDNVYMDFFTGEVVEFGPALEGLFRDAGEGKFDVVVVAHPLCWFRNAVEGWHYTRQLKKEHGIEVVFVIGGEEQAWANLT